tara:strand:+ start:303 stop:416 length:114 start_codon:yes stop_codon:yes gene_type:complete
MQVLKEQLEIQVLKELLEMTVLKASRVILVIGVLQDF